MATPRKRTVKIVADEGYSKLEQYAIEVHEFYKALRKAGFTSDNALWLSSTREAYPEWMQSLSPEDIRKHIEEEDE
jgi:hypothetical protein